MGTDLAVAEVVGDEILCPFHAWKFDMDGKVTEILVGDPVPPKACAFSFPTEERLGLIWAFNGEKPLYDPPTIPYDEGSYTIRVHEPFEHPVEHALIIANGFDFQHLIALHKLDLVTHAENLTFNKTTASYNFKFKHPSMGYMELDYQLYGTNCFRWVVHVPSPDGDLEIVSYWSSGPIPGNCTRGWFTVAVKNPDDMEKATEVVEGLLDTADSIITGLMLEDEPILQTIRFSDHNLSQSDGMFAKYTDYLRKFPRAHPAQQYMT